MSLSLPYDFGLPIWAVILLTIWIFVWKGLALWKSAQLKHKVWFVLLLIINTFAIFEILYIFLFSKIRLDNSAEIKKSKARKKR